MTRTVHGPSSATRPVGPPAATGAWTSRVLGRHTAGAGDQAEGPERDREHGGHERTPAAHQASTGSVMRTARAATGGRLIAPSTYRRGGRLRRGSLHGGRDGRDRLLGGHRAEQREGRSDALPGSAW